ncbi:MAG: DUF192 domain-containing protein [Candidatus Pacearchaeota archaeon]|nr:DUF192 domain-containing protein [Candidatus Pacearchaeota archaeon]
MKKQIHFYYKKDRINLVAEECGFFRRFIGLMFSSRKNAKILLFNFKKPWKIRIHSFYVFFPFIAVWLDKSNNIVDIKTVKPFTFSVFSKKPAFKLIEIPINDHYKQIITILTTSRR